MVDDSVEIYGNSVHELNVNRPVGELEAVFSIILVS